MRFNSWRQGIAVNVDDFRPSIDAASPEVGRRSDAATEGAAFAAVVPLRKIPPTYPNQRLSPDRLRQIDRVFFGPFFREKYGMGGDKALENGRIHYYGPVQPANSAREKVDSPPQTTIMWLLSGADHDWADTCEERDLYIAMASFPVASRSSC
jgi:hypothetical protein